MKRFIVFAAIAAIAVLAAVPSSGSAYESGTCDQRFDAAWNSLLTKKLQENRPAADHAYDESMTIVKDEQAGTGNCYDLFQAAWDRILTKKLQTSNTAAKQAYENALSIVKYNQPPAA